MKLTYKIIPILAVLFLVGCDDYLDVQPKGLVVPKTIKDYDLLLNGGSRTINTTGDENTLFMTADDFVSASGDLGNIDAPDNVDVMLYSWSKNLFKDEKQHNAWDLPYQNIYTYNKVINNIDDAEGALKYTDDDRNRIAAEAKVGRAYEYWLLVNTFAKQYDESTARSTPGVPLVTIANTSESAPSRSSVKEVYDLIIGDVEDAIADLPTRRVNAIRPSKGAGHAFLARFYLSKGDYTNALKNASLAIAEKGDIGNYTIDFASELPKEQYITRFYGYTRGFYKGGLDDTLTASFAEGDARKSGGLNNCNWVFDPVTGWTQVCDGPLRNSLRNDISHAPSVPEMYLIRAECNARLSASMADIVSDMNALLSKRIYPSMFTPLNESSFTNMQEALDYVLKERRKEMILSGMRLFDLKRLNLEDRYKKTVTHKVGDNVYTLEPNGNNYVLPIPQTVINFNPQMKQNPRD